MSPAAKSAPKSPDYKKFTCMDIAKAVGLRAGRRIGQECSFTCTQHDDEHPSLMINSSKDVWMCGPCNKGGTPWQLAAFISGREPGDSPGISRWLQEHSLLSADGRPKVSRSEGRIVAKYAYVDEHHNHLFNVVRYEPKAFSQEKPNGTAKLNGVRRILYRLAELSSASEIFVVEGEKDVDNLRLIGLVATCNPGGAGKWRTEYAQCFKADQCVFIIPDNDEAGGRHAIQVASSLHGRVATVKIVQLPELPDKGDVSDWLDGKDRNKAAAELAQLAASTPLWTPLIEPVRAQVDFVIPPHWKRLDLAKIESWNCEPLRPIVEGLIALGNLVYVVAETQTGKTLLCVYIARKLLHNGNLFGKFPITPVNRVLYLVLEDPERRIQQRLLDTQHEFSSAPLEPNRCVFHVVPGFDLAQEGMCQWLESIIASEKPAIIFLDTYQRATPGVLSFDDEKQSLILHRLSDLTRRLNVTIVIIDHVRKRDLASRRKELSVDDIKGTGGKAQNADCVILMERTPDRRQIKLQSFSKDFEFPVRILLNVAPMGSREPKFTYARDLDEASMICKNPRVNRRRVLEAMPNGEWIAVPSVAGSIGLGATTVQNHIKLLVKDGLVRDNQVAGKGRKYQRIATSQGGDKNGVSI